MIYLFWVAVLCVIALSFSLLFNKRIELTLAPAIFAAILVMYLFGIFDALYWGLFAVILCAAACGVYIVMRMAREKTLFTDKWLTPGGLILAVFVVLIALMHAYRIPAIYDEYGHWAWVVKFMYYDDALATLRPGACGFPNYPPATALLEYMFARFTPDFTENYMYRALTLFYVSLLLPITSFFDWRRFPAALASFLTLFFIPTFFIADAYTVVLVDAALGLIFFYLLFIWITRDKTDIFLALSLCAGAAVLLLTKRSGVFFLIVALALVIAESAKRFRAASGRSERLGAALPALALAGGGLFSLVSWEIVKYAYISSKGLSAPFGLTGVWESLKGLFGPWSAYMSSVAENFTEVLVAQTYDSSVSVSPLLWAVLCAALLSLAFYLDRKSGERFASRRWSVFAAVFGGLAVYLLLMFFMYCFIFDEYQGFRLAAWTRYSGSYYIALALICVSLPLVALYRGDRPNKKPAALFPSFAALGLALFLAPSLLFLFLPQVGIKENERVTASYLTSASFPAELTREDRVYYWYDVEDGFGRNVAKYKLYPAEVSASAGFNLSLPDSPSPAELAAALEGYDYLYIQNIAENSKEKYAELFDSAPKVGVYKIDTSSGALRLERLTKSAAAE